MDRWFLFFVFLCSFFGVFSQAPPWIDYEFRSARYNSDLYLTGYVSEKLNPEENQGDFMARLEGYAKNQLAETVLIEIRAENILNIQNTNGTSREFFRKRSISESEVRINGVQLERYFDEQTQFGHVLAFADKKLVINAQKSLIDRQIHIMKELFQQYERKIESGDVDGALKKLVVAGASISAMESAQVLLANVSGVFDEEQERRDEVNALRERRESALDDLGRKKLSRLNDLATYVTFTLSQIDGNKKKTVKVHYPTYRESELASEFSRFLKFQLDKEFSKIGYNPVDREVDADLVIRSTYWEDDENIRLEVNQFDNKEAMIGSMNGYLKKQFLELEQIDYVPIGFDQAIQRIGTISNDEIRPEALYIDLTTNKGSKDLVFSEGERMTISTVVNQNAYLRLVYYLADGSKVLLLDNYRFNKSPGNDWKELPFVFECAAPFGVELLQLIAQVEPFNPVETISVEGYEMIQGETENVVGELRGLKKVGDSFAAEKRLIITTLPGEIKDSN